MFQIFELCQVIISKWKVLKHGKLRNTLNLEDVVVTEVQNSQVFEFVQILHFLDHVILQEQVL